MLTSGIQDIKGLDAGICLSVCFFSGVQEIKKGLIQVCMSTILDSDLGHKHQKIKVQKNMQNRLFIELRNAPAQYKYQISFWLLFRKTA